MAVIVYVTLSEGKGLVMPYDKARTRLPRLRLAMTIRELRFGFRRVDFVRIEAY